MKLALGTVQFGLDYGISNKAGRVSTKEVTKILALADEVGIDTLDSATAYGDSEQQLGNQSLSQRFKIVTKIPALTNDIRDITPFVENSLIQLKRDKLDSLLFHDAKTVLTHPHAAHFCEQLLNLKQQQKIERIGVSIYQPDQITQALQRLDVELVQAPANVLDQRIFESDIKSVLEENKIDLHTRSAFLQGLLLMPEEEWPTYFSPYFHLLEQFTALAKQYQVSKLTLALAFLVHNSLNNKQLEKIVVGCCSAEQLLEIVNSYKQAKTLSIPPSTWQSLASDEQQLINPSFWQI